jgi:hypothetical protein
LRVRIFFSFANNKEGFAEDRVESVRRRQSSCRQTATAEKVMLWLNWWKIALGAALVKLLLM